jgi:hypothetical protein
MDTASITEARVPAKLDTTIAETTVNGIGGPVLGDKK